jgi:hypothetical protein
MQARSAVDIPIRQKSLTAYICVSTLFSFLWLYHVNLVSLSAFSHVTLVAVFHLFQSVPIDWIPASGVTIVDDIPQPDQNGHIPGRNLFG